MNSNQYTLDYKHQCAAWTINNLGPMRRQCALGPSRNIGGWIYLCNRHYDIIFREVEEEVASVQSRRMENMRARMAEMEKQLSGQDDYPAFLSPEEYEARRKAQTVYFIRCEQYMKIGISYDPVVRLNQIRKGGGSLFPKRMDVTSAELVTTEAGGFDREKELHERFAHLRHTGEWFTEAPELTAYIEGLAA